MAAREMPSFKVAAAKPKAKARTAAKKTASVR
jgi:hypothetical protein